MVARNLKESHRFVCVTDDTTGLHPGVESVPMPEDAGEHWRCCRRLRMFSPDWRDILGDRVLHLDLDTVIVGDITPLATLPYQTACWWAPQYATPHLREPYMAFNPSVLLFDPDGPLRECWDVYAKDPAAALDQAERNGWNKWNSDMAILNDYVHRRSLLVRPIGVADGVYGLRDDLMPTGSPELPVNARLLSFCDPQYDPAMPELQARHPWIAEHYR
jgi:hypothetical protein